MAKSARDRHGVVTTLQFFILFSDGGALTPQFGNPADVDIPVAGDFNRDVGELTP